VTETDLCFIHLPLPIRYESEKKEKGGQEWLKHGSGGQPSLRSHSAEKSGEKEESRRYYITPGYLLAEEERGGEGIPRSCSGSLPAREEKKRKEKEGQ